jgi:hypothetical protein
MSETNGHAPDAEDRLMESNVVWPEPWRITPHTTAEAQERIRAQRLAELRERFGEEAA